MHLTQMDVAKKAGVSRKAVFFALSSDPRFNRKLRAETRQRILKTVQHMGYAPHHAARTLKSGKTFTIVLATQASFKYAYVHDLYEQIELALAPHGYHLDLKLLAHAKEPEAAYRSFTFGRCDGVISFNIIAAFHDELRWLRRQGMPVVTMDLDTHPDLDNVYFEHAREAEIGTTHLLEQGYRRIVFVINTGENCARRSWQEGYERAVRAASISPDLSNLIPWRVGDDVQLLWERIRDVNPAVDGVIVYNAEIAAQLSRAIRKSGVKVPEELGIVSCGDADFNNYLDVPMTAVKVDQRGIAAAVVERLLGQIRNRRTPAKHVWLNSSLIPRASTARSNHQNILTPKGESQ